MPVILKNIQQYFSLLLLSICIIQGCHSRDEETQMYQNSLHEKATENIEQLEKVYKTAESHQVVFSTDDNGATIARVTYSLPEGFSCSKQLPVVKDRGVSSESINETQSKSIVRLAKDPSGKEVVLISEISLKGGSKEGGLFNFGGSQKSTFDRISDRLNERSGGQERAQRESAQRSEMGRTFREHGVELGSRQGNSSSSNSGGFGFSSSFGTQSTGSNYLSTGTSLGFSPQMTLGSLGGGSSSSNFSQNQGSLKQQLGSIVKKSSELSYWLEAQNEVESITVRRTMAKKAFECVGRKDWGMLASKFKEGQYPGLPKCNEFVAYVVNESGAEIDIVNISRLGLPGHHPTASQWHNPNFYIPGWPVLDSYEKPDSGDIGASKKHCALIYEYGLSISSSYEEGWIFGFIPTTDVGIIVMNDWGFREDQKGEITFRRFKKGF